MLKETLAALDLRVEIADVTHHPKLKPGDMVRYEQHFGRSLMSSVDTNEKGEPQSFTFGVTELFFLAWTALHRMGEFDGDFDAFVDQVDDVSVGDVEPGKGEAA